MDLHCIDWGEEKNPKPIWFEKLILVLIIIIPIIISFAIQEYAHYNNLHDCEKVKCSHVRKINKSGIIYWSNK